MNYIQRLFMFSHIMTKRFIRDKTAMFFTFVFPLIFLSVFGGIFGKGGGARFDVVIINNSGSEFAKNFKEDLQKTEFLKIKDSITDLERAKTALSRSEIDSILILPADFGEQKNSKPSGVIEILFDKSKEDTAATLSQVMSGVAEGINENLLNIKEKPITVKLSPADVNSLTRFDYTVAGLLGFSIMSMGVFSMANGFVGDKKNGALKRLMVTPLKSRDLILATMINRVLIGLSVIAMMLIFAKLVYGFQMKGSIIVLIGFTVYSSILLFGFGMAIAGWAKNENQAAPISNLVTFPMMFLSGAFFPTYLMGDTLQKITKFIPLTPVIDGMRYIIAGTASWSSMWSGLVIMGAWTIIIYLISFKVFRWE